MTPANLSIKAELKFQIPELQNSLILIDKPIGPTSHKTTEYVKKILGVKKAGHSGTLDPKVSGILPIALNKATRILELLLNMPKEYVGVMRLHSDLNVKEIRNKIKEKFLGKIRQVPPRKSSVKRREREREIYEFRILEKRNKEVLFRVKCEAGTYIRKLIHDLGEELNIGAHMKELRRISVGFLKEKDALTLYELYDIVKLAKKSREEKLKKVLIPLEKIVLFLPKINLKNSLVKKVKHGQYIPIKNIKIKGYSKNFTKVKDIYAGFSKNKFICLLKLVKKNSGTWLKPDKVFI